MSDEVEIVLVRLVLLKHDCSQSNFLLQPLLVIKHAATQIAVEVKPVVSRLGVDFCREVSSDRRVLLNMRLVTSIKCVQRLEGRTRGGDYSTTSKDQQGPDDSTHEGETRQREDGEWHVAEASKIDDRCGTESIGRCGTQR